jgi:hypothetical protein
LSKKELSIESDFRDVILYFAFPDLISPRNDSRHLSVGLISLELSWEKSLETDPLAKKEMLATRKPSLSARKKRCRGELAQSAATQSARPITAKRSSFLCRANDYSAPRRPGLSRNAESRPSCTMPTVKRLAIFYFEEDLAGDRPPSC